MYRGSVPVFEWGLWESTAHDRVALLNMVGRHNTVRVDSRNHSQLMVRS
jgi:hypothetical protein